MKSIRLIFFCILIYISSNAQSNKTYQSLIAQAGLLHLQKNPKKAVQLYEKAFEIQQPDALTAYKVAGIYSLNHDSKKAFQYLRRSLSSGWTEADWLLYDPYFDYLRKNDAEKWKEIEEIAIAQEKQYEKTLKLPALRKEINLMCLNDQKLRYRKSQNTDESLAKTIDQQINEADSFNLIQAKKIIKQYGWPKISDIGKDGQNNLWLIVQHADQDVLFQNEALSEMEKLIGTKDLNMENYAFLYDRVQCNLNYRQLYGTQVIWSGNGEASGFRPIIRENLTNERRNKLGLQPLEIYSLIYGFSYQPIDSGESAKRESACNSQVKELLNNAKKAYKAKEFQKTYDDYNTASTFLGGMSNNDNFEASILFSKIAKVDKDEKYKGIALDFLDLLYLRGRLTKNMLLKQSDFRILYQEKRWIDLLKKLD
ncbi:tetratricopeptide repeat protein [Epilithonimonas mollis]|uniref:Tetratricopeptide repeat protein n=1 Tax=Epilithonimonas mollis TaxID=216903 RepID=A0A1M6P3L2_9FLAO|nr:tetratricopeptide repeat protein [Epilithonimonas mollis]SHK02521.1 hypothetical protein SAMN05444371_0841 [Epilithonimonas mollis]